MPEESTETLDSILTSLREAHGRLAKLRLAKLEALDLLVKDPVIQKIRETLTDLSPMLIDNSTKTALVSYIQALEFLPQHVESCLAETKNMIGTE